MTDLCVCVGQKLPGPIYIIATEVGTALCAVTWQGERYRCLESLARVSIGWLRRFGEEVLLSDRCHPQHRAVATAESAEHQSSVTGNQLILLGKVRDHLV